MSPEFDPYHKLLGISPREQPPTYYRLLGVAAFEDDPEVIEASANRQMSYLQDRAAGPEVAAVQRLLNEVATARVCLLDQTKKSAYDHQLLAEQDTEATVNQMTETTVLSAPPVQVPPALQTVPTPPPAPALPRIATYPPPAPNSPLAAQGTLRPRQKSSSKVIPAVVTGLVCLILVAVTAVAITIGGSGDAGKPVQSKQPPAADRRAELAGQTNSSLADQRRGGDTRPAPRQDRSVTTSDMPAPGAYAKNEPHPVQRVEEFTPAQPSLAPKRTEPQQEMPRQLTAAMAALAEDDLPRMIRHLEDYLEGEPRPPWTGTARETLEQARFVASNERVLEFLDRELDKLTDDQFLALANGKSNLKYDTRRISNPALQKAFRRAVERNLSEAILRRLE